MALQTRLREYFEGIITPEIEEEMATGEMGGEAAKVAIRQMGKDGILGLGWPTEYGGGGWAPVEQFIFYDEAQRTGAPVPMLTINAVAPTIMQFGTQAQKDFFLPKILAGEIQFAIGYTEPGSGTDLASLKTKAERDGDEWLINGQKIFTSIAEHADYIWLAARTDPDKPKHRGISIFAVPVDSPGYSRTPIRIMGDAKTNATYYDNVKVPADALIGELNRGWDLIVNQLNHERVALGPPGLDRPPVQRREAVGPGDQGRGRPAGDRPGVGAAQPGARARQARGAAPHELEGGVERDGGHAEPGRRVGHQGVRHRAVHRGVPAVARDPRPGRRAQARLARGGAAGIAGAGLPGHAHPHLRRRHQRGAARPHRHLRPRHADEAFRHDRHLDMNWDLNEEQQAIKELTAQILDSERATWDELAKADLLGVCLPEKYGGSGHGIFELGLMLEEQGRAGVHLPLLPTLACAMAIAQFGTDKQKDDWLPGVVSGDVVLTAVLNDHPPFAPYARQAGAVFVGNTLYAKDALELIDLDTTSGEPQAVVHVRGADPGPHSRANRWLLDRWTAGLCMLQVGLADKALRLTAEYTTGASSSASPSPPSRPWASGRPTRTSTPRPCGSPPTRRRGAWPRACRQPTSWRWPSSGRPRAATG